MTVTSYIGIGSNVGDRLAAIRRSLALLTELGDVTLSRVSTIYETAPQGLRDQPDFLNAVAEIQTALPARSLLRELFSIEARLGRERRVRWGPRTIDLDVLLYGDETIDEPDLVVPHPRMYERAFVVVLLAELAPGLTDPQGRTLDRLAEDLASDQFVRPYAALPLLSN